MSGGFTNIQYPQRNFRTATMHPNNMINQDFGVHNWTFDNLYSHGIEFVYMTGTNAFIHDIRFDNMTGTNAYINSLTGADCVFDTYKGPSLTQNDSYTALVLDMNTKYFHYNQDSLTPAGTVHQYAGASAPAGFLLCNGGSYSTTTYARLFAIIGYTYGGAGASFNVPNLVGKVAVGYDASQTYFNSLGKTGGENTHVLLSSEMPVHNHGINDPGHVHSYTASNNSNQNVGYPAGGGSPDVNQGTYSANTGSASTGITTQTAGSGEAHNNLQPYITLNYIIKT